MWTWLKKLNESRCWHTGGYNTEYLGKWMVIRQCKLCGRVDMRQTKKSYKEFLEKRNAAASPPS